jgi:hypothetical protein
MSPTEFRVKIGVPKNPKIILKYILAIPLIAAATFFYIRFPVAVILIALIISITLVGSDSAAKYLTVIILTSILSWINSGKYLSGDLTWYYDHFILLNKIPLMSYLGSTVNQFTIKAREPFYYTVSFILSRLSNGNLIFLNLFITAWLYLLTGISFSKIVSSANLSRVRAMAAVVAAMLTGVTFSLTTHLVRQEFAAAALLCCAVSLFYNHKKLVLIFCIISATSHESAYIPLSCLFIGFYFTKFKNPSKKLNPIFFIVFLLIFLGAGLYYSNNIAFDSPYQRIRSDGEISLAVMLLDAALYTIVILHALHTKNQCIKNVALIVALYFAFLIGVSASPLPFLRMYFYIDIVRGCEVFYISIILLRSSYGILFIAPIVIISTLYAELRIISSGFYYYGGGIINHLLLPVFFI